MSQAGKRLTILSKSEIEELYGLPQFSDAERQLFFGLNDSERQAAESRNSIESRVHFILQLGYFKCKTTFFNFSFTQVRDDVKYIVGMYFPNAKIPTIMISKKTSLGQQSSILNLLNIQYFNQKKQNELSVFLNKEVRTCVDPRYLFDKTLDFLNQHNISLPGYSTLQDMISQTLTAEDQRLQKIIQQNLSTSVNQSLSKMLEADDEKMYGITLLKRDAKGFNTTEMTKEIHKQLASTEIFTAAKQIIPKLQISDQNIRYYAYLVDYYTVDRLKELSGHAAKLYLLCYALYRFEKINDNLVYGFIYHLNSYKKEAKEYGKDAVYGFKVEGQQYGKKIGKILDLFTDEKIADSNPFGDVRSLAFRVVKKEKFPVMKRHVTRDFDEEEFRWSYYKKIARTISRNLRPIVKVLDFASEEKNLPLMQAITFLKETWKSGKSLTQMSETKFPTSCITKSLEAYLYETVSGTKEKGKKEKPKKILNVYAYEFMVYDQLAKALESGGLFINNSFRFKSLQEDLIPDWQTKKGTILADLNNLMLNTPIKKQLETFKEELESLIVKVNKRIANGENKHVTIKTSKDKTGLETKTWALAYPKKDDEINNPFYEQFPKLNLNQVLRFVDKHCSFTKEFIHIKSRYAKTTTFDEDALFACLTADATNYGIYQMAAISDIGYKKLLSTSKNHIRLETLKKANDRLRDSIAALPIFPHWDLMEKQLIAALDGKKVQTRIKHIMARHSPKYFGQKRGIVSYSMNLNHMGINGKIIGANDHESHHVYDLVYNNTSIQADWHCGDTHSINQLNSSLLHLLEKKFTPHIKKVVHKASTIVSFNTPSIYNDYLIKPNARVHTNLIEEEWDNMKHIYASLLMKETSQSVVVSKLSSHKRSNKTQRAMWEYDNILTSIHILKFIDDPDYRQAIRGALNRVEGYHQLIGKIGGVNGGKFRGTSETELAIWNECCMLIANCIIYYNGIILSKIYQQQEKLGNTKVLEFIKRLSPIAWCHIILDGCYRFRDKNSEINLDKIIENLIFDIRKNVKSTIVA